VNHSRWCVKVGVPQVRKSGCPFTTPAAECRNNLKQIGIAIHNQTADVGALTAGPRQVQLCAAARGHQINIIDGTSNTVMVGELPARLSGCPADLEDFGEATVRTRDLPDGRTELTLVSRTHRGCTASALLVAAMPDPPKQVVHHFSLSVMKLEEAGFAPDTRRISPRTRDGYREFWGSLDRAEATALARRLEELAGRARRGANVDREVEATLRQYPTLRALAAGLEREPLVFVGPDGGEQPLTCIGVGYIDVHGNFVCIGVLVD
jgi:hypothetical protein